MLVYRILHPKRIIVFLVPGAPPLSVTATTRFPSSLNITWLEIAESQRNGIILSYVIKYKRTDGKGLLTDLTAYGTNALLQNLAADTEYDVQVAGVTSKGHGIFSRTAVFKTLESGMDFAVVIVMRAYHILA